MNSIELAKSIYQRAVENGKQAWLSDKQNSFIFSLLEKEGRLNEKASSHFIAHILPNGDWIKDLTIGESIKIGEELESQPSCLAAVSGMLPLTKEHQCFELGHAFYLVCEINNGRSKYGDHKCSRCGHIEPFQYDYVIC